MECKENQWKLFPHGYVIVYREVFSLLSTNYDIIVQDICKGAPILSSLGKNSQWPHIESISFANIAQVKRGLFYRINYYGYDVDDAFAHALHHLLESYKHHRGGDHSIDMFCYVSLDTSSLEEKLTCDAGVLTTGSGPKEQFACEMDMGFLIPKPQL